jgi:hypothetical protein
MDVNCDVILTLIASTNDVMSNDMAANDATTDDSGSAAM